MQLRYYQSDRDFPYIKQWITDARTHAKWCANLIPHPLTKDGFDQTLMEQKQNWGDVPYVFTDDEDVPIGFLAYSVNQKYGFGFLKFVVVDDRLRGGGYGVKMMEQIKKLSFEKAEITSVKLNVFDVNPAAIRCYKKAGFEIMSHKAECFYFEEEMWGQFIMSAPRNT